MYWITFLLSAISAAYASQYENPTVLEPKNMTYNVGMTIPIKWKNPKTGFVNIEVVNTYKDVLNRPIMIASGVPAEKGVFEWKIPEVLKTAVGYEIFVWGTQQPGRGDTNGVSQMFTIFNDVPNAVNNFIVLSPNSKKPCAINNPCKIAWDYPETINPPNEVHIGLYRVGESKPIYNIGTVNAATKSFTWDVPNDPSLLSGNVFISVDGSGVVPVGPKMATNMGANSQAFTVTETLVKTAEEIAAEKAEADKKKKEEEEEEEKKKKEEEEAKKKLEEEEAEKRKREEEKKKLSGRVNKQSKNNASANMGVSVVGIVGSVAAAIFFLF